MSRATQHKLAVAANLVASAVGVGLIFAPHWLGHEATPAAGVERTIGPLIAAFALIGCWECTRGVRWLNVPLALTLAGLALSPRPSFPTAAIWADVAAAVAVIGLTLLPHPRVGRYGGGWRRLLRSPPTSPPRGRTA